LAPVHLPNISRSAELLSRAVAPTSGFGLNDIWLSWTSSISPRSYVPELEQALAGADVIRDGYSKSLTPGVPVLMLTPTQKHARSYWSTLLRNI